MVALFKRFFIPAVKLETPQGTITNLDGQGLRFEWTIVRDNTNNPDEGEIRIFNLSPKFSGLLFEAWQQITKRSPVGYLVVFSIGWDRVTKQVFSGDVWNLVPQRRIPPEVLTVFSLGDGNTTMRDGVVGKTFTNVPIAVLLENLVFLPPNALDVGLGGLGLLFPAESKALVEAAAAELAVKTNFTNFTNFPAGRNTRDSITIIMETLGLEWRIHNGAFIALRGGIINRPGPILRPSSGLLTYEPRNDGGIVLEALANPDVEPGIQIQVQSNLGKPVAEIVYRVERVTFSGSTDENSTMVIEAAKGRVL